MIWVGEFFFLEGWGILRMRDLEWSAKAQQFWCSLRPLESFGEKGLSRATTVRIISFTRAFAAGSCFVHMFLG